LAVTACSGGGTDVPGTDVPRPGETEFTSEDPRQEGRNAVDGAEGSGDLSAPAAQSDKAAPGAPGGRMGDVEEGDIYRVDGNRLFYLNTYRGFLAYDVTNPKAPRRLGRLPIHGYPVEMFVEGNTVYALLRDALYLTQKAGAFRFERHNVSQLVAIDVTDIANPRVLNTTDIIGELREGVSRKIENTIYVVSDQSQSYWWGWRAPDQTPPKDQAWVYSFDVVQPQAPKLVQKLQIFEGGNVSIKDPKTNKSYKRYFQGVTIAATANALMVVENWYINAYNNGGSPCGSWESDQQAVVSIIDISDPKGAIRRHTRFTTAGALGDQFKQTYVFDPATKTGTYYGIFARQAWSSAGCEGEQQIRNSLESWDVTNGEAPVRLQRLDFGKPGETVRGSAFDVERNVVYAITARQIDPLYAISIADPRNLKVMSAIDGLSGDMTVFRLIEGKKFLIGIGRDTSETCMGFQEDPNAGWRASNIAVSIIDVRNLADIRLVQRQCVAVKNAEWVGSELSWNLDQAHKMIGMHSDASANVITVPVFYWKKEDTDRNDWWWYREETAVGMMTWDLASYAAGATNGAAVLKNFGTLVHPEGEVRRSIVFTHQGTATPRRMMINLSDTHISIADVQDLANPQIQSMVELAPFHSAIYTFGDHVVEEVRSSPNNYGHGGLQGRSEFRIKAAGGNLEDKPVLASFSVGGVFNVFKVGSKMVVLRRNAPVQRAGVYIQPSVKALVYDLSNPAAPKRGGSVDLPNDVSPWYGFYCGTEWGGGYTFGDDVNRTVEMQDGLAMLYSQWGNSTVSTQLALLDISNPAAPTVSLQTVNTQSTNNGYWGDSFGLVADPMDSKGFYVVYRDHVGEVKRADRVLDQFRDYARRWQRTDVTWTAGDAINTPGRLIRTYAAADGTRMFLTQDYRWTWNEVAAKDGNSSYGEIDSRLRLFLLRQINKSGRPAAELLSSRVFEDMYPSSLVLEGEKLFVVGSEEGGYGGYYRGGGFGGGDVAVASGGFAQTVANPDRSDRLIAFDLARKGLDVLYDARTNMHDVQLVGVHSGRLFFNVAGDGLLVGDVSNPARPGGLRFLRTLGWSSHVAFAGNDVYVASGYFGVYHMPLAGPPVISMD
jgi:hypothetical protein